MHGFKAFLLFSSLFFFFFYSSYPKPLPLLLLPSVPTLRRSGEPMWIDRLTEKKKKSMQDLSLPRTMVQRLAKGVLPSNTQIQKDALTAMSKAATVFVNYLSQA